MAIGFVSNRVTADTFIEAVRALKLGEGWNLAVLRHPIGRIVTFKLWHTWRPASSPYVPDMTISEYDLDDDLAMVQIKVLAWISEYAENPVQQETAKWLKKAAAKDAAAAMRELPKPEPKPVITRHIDFED